MFLDKIIEGMHDDRNALDKFIEIFQCVKYIPDLIDFVTKLREEVKQIQMDISKLSANFSTFATNFEAMRTDLTTFLGTVTPADPAQQTAIDAITAKLGDLNNEVTAMDASLKPAAGTGTGTGTGGV